MDLLSLLWERGANERARCQGNSEMKRVGFRIPLFEAAGLDFDGEEGLLRRRQVERGFRFQRDHRRLCGADVLQDGSRDAGQNHRLPAVHDEVIQAGLHGGIHDHLGEVAAVPAGPWRCGHR